MTVVDVGPAMFKKALIYRAERQIAREIHRPGSPLRTMILRAPLQEGGERERDTYDNHVHAVQRVLVLLMTHMDIVTLIVGRSADDKEHFGLLVRTIAEKLNMAQRTVERAIHTIHALGWMRTKTRAELTADGRYIGRTAIRFFSEPFFALIGLAKRLARRREAEYQIRKSGRELRAEAMRQLQHVGRCFVESRPGRALQAAAAVFRPPDPAAAV